MLAPRPSTAPAPRRGHLSGRFPGRKTASGRFFAPGRGKRLENQSVKPESRQTTDKRDDLDKGADWTGDLDYQHAPYYSPHAARYWSIDPLLASAEPTRPQTWNRYSYVSGNPMKYIDPTGEILFFFGLKDDLQQVEDVANDQLHGVDLVIGQNGKASLVPNQEEGPASPEQQAFESQLTSIIENDKNIGVNVVSGDSGVRFGQFISATIDIADIATVGPGRVVNSASILAHELAEQTTAQLENLPLTQAGFDRAHSVGLRAQSRITGYQRSGGSQARVDAQFTGFVTNRNVRGREVVLVTFRFVNGNVVRAFR